MIWCGLEFPWKGSPSISPLPVEARVPYSPIPPINCIPSGSIIPLWGVDHLNVLLSQDGSKIFYDEWLHDARPWLCYQWIYIYKLLCFFYILLPLRYVCATPEIKKKRISAVNIKENIYRWGPFMILSTILFAWLYVCCHGSGSVYKQKVRTCFNRHTADDHYWRLAWWLAKDEALKTTSVQDSL